MSTELLLFGDGPYVDIVTQRTFCSGHCLGVCTYHISLLADTVRDLLAVKRA
jgi:hypothetical protein